MLDSESKDGSTATGHLSAFRVTDVVKANLRPSCLLSMVEILILQSSLSSSSSSSSKQLQKVSTLLSVAQIPLHPE